MGFVKIGEGKIKVINDSIPGGTYLKADVQTTGVIKLLYNARYFYSADMDTKTGLPYKANKILNEGKFILTNSNCFLNRGLRISGVYCPGNRFSGCPGVPGAPLYRDFQPDQDS